MHSTNFHFYNTKYYLYSNPIKGLQGCGVGYRFGFNGKERDNETYGEGNAYDFGARIYDSRLGRWLSVDIETSKTPYMTPYHFALDNPIVFIDPDGNTEYFFQGKWIGTDGKENNLIGVIQDESVSVEIIKNSKLGLKVPEVTDLKNGDKITGGMAIDKNVLAVSNEVLKRAMESNIKDEEFGVSLDKKDGSYVKNGEIISNNSKVNENGVATISLPNGEVSVHSHPCNDAEQVIMENGKPGTTASTARPSDDDVIAFKKSKMNIIVGREKKAESKNTNIGGTVVTTVSEETPVINIYGKNTVKDGNPIFTISQDEAKNIIKNGNSGNVYKKFKKNEAR